MASEQPAVLQKQLHRHQQNDTATTDYYNKKCTLNVAKKEKKKN